MGQNFFAYSFSFPPRALHRLPSLGLQARGRAPSARSSRVRQDRRGGGRPSRALTPLFASAKKKRWARAGPRKVSDAEALGQVPTAPCLGGREVLGNGVFLFSAFGAKKEFHLGARSWKETRGALIDALNLASLHCFLYSQERGP